MDVEPHSSTPIIVRARAADIDRAVTILKDELLEFDKYTKVGWGWAFGNHVTRRFFVRRTKDGLSCTAPYKDGEAAKPEPSSTSDDSGKSNV